MEVAKTHVFRPMTFIEVERILKENDGRLVVRVSVDLEEIIHCQSMDGFNALMELRLLSVECPGTLADISYMPKMVEDSGDIVIEVNCEFAPID